MPPSSPAPDVGPGPAIVVLVDVVVVVVDVVDGTVSSDGLTRIDGEIVTIPNVVVVMRDGANADAVPTAATSTRHPHSAAAALRARVRRLMPDGT